MTYPDKKVTDRNDTANTQKDWNANENAVIKAHKVAEKDIKNDPDLQNDPTDDLDEGELARLEGED